MDNKRAVSRLKEQLERISEIKKTPSFSPEFKKWKRDTEVAIQKIFGENGRHLKDFRGIGYSLGVFSTGTPEEEFEQAFREGLDEAASIIQSFLDEIKDYGLDRKHDVTEPSTLASIKKICDRFHLIVRQLRSRHEGRQTISVEDEYDVQDLFHALLKLEFDDVRPEEWTPSCAGSASRMDFLLKKEQIVVEVKKTRKGLGVKEIGEQLLTDISRYQAHPECRTLVCFVYDPEARISNPRGIENDLSRQHDSVFVKVFVTPKGL